jgi:hypothetical protein
MEKRKEFLLYALTHRNVYIRGDWSHYADTGKPVVDYGANNAEIMLSNPGFESATFRSLSQRANQLRYLGPLGWMDGRTMSE